MKKRDRRAIGAGAMVVLPVVCALWGVPKVVGWFQSTRSRLDATQSVYTRQLQQLSLLPVLEAESDSLRSAFTALAGQLLAATTEPAAQSELLGYLEEVARSVGASLEQVEPLADSLGEDRLRRVRARAVLSATLDEFLEFATRIEWGRQIMLITALRIEPAGEDALKALRVEAVVEAWFLRAGPAGHA